MKISVIILVIVIVAVVAEPPASNGGEPIEGGNYVDDALLRRISDILNGGSAGDSGNSRSQGSYSAPAPSRSQGSYSAPAPSRQSTFNSDPEDTYGTPARSAPQNSYNNAPSSKAQNPKPLGRVILQSPELAPVVASFELDGGTESRGSAKSSYGAPNRNGGSY